MKPKNILWPGIALFLLLFSCKKDSSPQGSGSTTPPPPPPPVIGAAAITGINPGSGPMATVVTISGSNFNTDMTRDTVWFDSVAAVVQQATATQLTVTVPKSAGTGAVIVKTGGTTATGPVFNYIYTVTVSTLAGNGTAGSVNGTGTAAEFFSPGGLSVNPYNSLLYVADIGNNSIRGLSTGTITGGGGGQNQPPAGITSGVAGNGTSGYVDGAAATAEFKNPTGLIADAAGNLFVADAQNNAIREISTVGMVSTFAGGVSGFADGKGTAAKFFGPADIVMDNGGNYYVSDRGNQRIRRIAPDGTVSTLAGTNTPGFVDGTGSGAVFSNPSGLGIDKQGNIYVADVANNSIRKITPAGKVTTIGGTGATGYYDGAAATSRFWYPSDVAVDARGNVYVADTYNDCIRMITPGGTVSTIAGNAGVPGGYKDGDGSVALFNRPGSIIVDAQGNIYVADSMNNRIRKITIQ